MDKRIVFAVAGSGKTRMLIERLNIEERFLIVTYTDNNYSNIKNRIVLKFGYHPKNISVFTYFSFIYSFCTKPYLQDKYKLNGIAYDIPGRYNKGINRYIDKNKRVYSNRLAKLLKEERILPEICSRIERFFDNFYIDEIQDFGGHDFNFIIELLKSDINHLYVGDFYQYTYDTSRDGNVNKNLHNDYEDYKSRFSDAGMLIDVETLGKSYRCMSDVCEFVKNKLGIQIGSHYLEKVEVHLLENQKDIDKVMIDDNIVKLFYQNHTKYNCYSCNWGASKGEDKYESICVVLNKSTYNSYVKNKLLDLNSLTRNKLYVACTRAKSNLYFVEEARLKEFKVK